jgi:hypothetical protein
MAPAFNGHDDYMILEKIAVGRESMSTGGEGLLLNLFQQHGAGFREASQHPRPSWSDVPIGSGPKNDRPDGCF